MADHASVLRKLRSATARYYPVDFHVHSPASHDAATPSCLQEYMDGNSVGAGAAARDEAAVQAGIAADYLNELTARRDGISGAVGASDSDNWAVVALTDHNVCAFSAAVSELAWSSVTSRRLIVLPGIELEVRHQVAGQASSIHVLCIFAPCTKSDDIRLAVAQASDTNWEPGDGVDVRCLAEFVDGLRMHAAYPSICVAAHVTSSKGIQAETKKAVLSNLEAEISRLEGELEADVSMDAVEIRERLQELFELRGDADGVSREILKLIGACGFDALQVTGRGDEKHYRRLHRFRERKGRGVPVVCSDAHSVDDVFKCDDTVPHIKISGLGKDMDPRSLFSEIRDRSLRLGETRFSFEVPDRVVSWIDGIVIERDSSTSADFWPFSSDGEKGEEFVMPFSRNLTCLIGGRGAGKSALIEATAFVCRPGDFDHGESEGDEYYARAAATLEGCRVSVYWRFLGDSKAGSLEKKALVMSRYFGANGRHDNVRFTDIRSKEIFAELRPNTSIQLYRLGDIEEHADAEHLRKLFDEICGEDVATLDAAIGDLKKQLESQREEMVAIADRVTELLEAESPLQTFVARKLAYDRVNEKGIQEAYELVDAVEYAQEVSQAAADGLRDEGITQCIDSLENAIAEVLDAAETECVDEDDYILEGLEDVYEAVKSEVDGEAAGEVRRRLFRSMRVVRRSMEWSQGELGRLAADCVENVTRARNALEEKGLPQGSMEREAKKAAFDEAEAALREYRELLAKWHELAATRAKWTAEMQDHVQSRSELRQRTAERITDVLARDLDASVLQVRADARAGGDRSRLRTWFEDLFAACGLRYRKVRIDALVDSGLEPSVIQQALSAEDGDRNIFKLDMGSASKGGIEEATSEGLYESAQLWDRLDVEEIDDDIDDKVAKTIPAEIREGLLGFNMSEDFNGVDAVLSLDEISFDDTPVILLNDRPDDSESVGRPIENLSRGQRCSAVLPILLLTGSAPLVIDQPEDNLDNRLIRQVIVNVLGAMKLRRQVIIATHNPNLPVLGDSEQAVILQGVRESECEVKAIGDLDDSEVVQHITEVMEGGREAFQYRHSIYQMHWPGTIADGE